MFDVDWRAAVPARTRCPFRVDAVIVSTLGQTGTRPCMKRG